MTDSEISNLEWKVVETSVAYRLSLLALVRAAVGPEKTPVPGWSGMIATKISAEREWTEATTALIAAREQKEKVETS